MTTEDFLTYLHRRSATMELGTALRDIVEQRNALNSSAKNVDSHAA
jgi:hypothetical protein